GAIGSAVEPRAPGSLRYQLLQGEPFRFIGSLGGFWPRKEFKLRADGRTPGEEIEFDEAFLFDESDTTGVAGLHWRFGEKWSLGAEAWKLDSGGGAVLTEDYEWQDLTFLEGTFASAGVELSVARVFLGRRLWSGDRWETGLGVGFHWLDLGAFIEGQILTDQGDTELERGAADAAFPMPNLGAWYLHSLSPDWAFTTRVDWLDVSLDEYSGNLWNIQLGVHWQAFEHVGFSLLGAYFELDGRIEETNWRGQVELKQYGPRANVYVTF
ncbi:MAG: hypothetical protein AAGH19_07175, partial [Pseudomonadota bacterium]